MDNNKSNHTNSVLDSLVNGILDEEKGIDLERKKSNMELLAILFKYLNDPANADIRLSQALRNLGFVKESESSNEWVNEFYTESKELLDRVKKNIKKI